MDFIVISCSDSIFHPLAKTTFIRCKWSKTNIKVSWKNVEEHAVFYLEILLHTLIMNSCKTSNINNNNKKSRTSFHLLRSGRGLRWDEAPITESLCLTRVSADQACRTNIGVHEMKWIKWMRWGWRNCGMKFVAGESGRNLMKNLSKLQFVCEVRTPEVQGKCLDCSFT